MTEMQIRIAADVEAALRSLQGIQKELDRTKLASENAGRGAENAAKGFKQIPQAANGATMAMTNLGRVVQDAPYGFIGIANILDPLLQSFQQLQKQAGGTGGALKALLGSLTGPGGVALGLSVVTTAITFAQIGFDRWFGTLGKNKGAVDEQAKEFERLAGVIKSLSGTVGNLTTEFGSSANAQIARVNALVAVTNNLSASDKERQNALAQLKQINKAYFGDITLTAKGLDLLSQRQIEYNKALQNQGAQTGFVNKLQEAETEATKVQNRVNTLENQLVKLRTELSKTPKFEIRGNVEVLTKDYRGLQDRITSTNSELIKQKGVLADLTDARVRLTQGLGETVSAGVSFKPLTDPKADANTIVQDTISEAKKIASATDQTISLRLNISGLDTEAEQFQKAKKFLDDWKKGAFKFTLEQPQIVEYPLEIKPIFPKTKLTGNTLFDIGVSIKELVDNTRVALDGTLKDITPTAALLENARKQYFDTSGVKYDLSLPQTKIDTKNFQKGVDKATKEIDQISLGFQQNIATAFQSGLEGIGESLGEAISGNDFGKSIIDVFSSLLGAVGKALIAYGIAKEGIDKILGPAGLAVPGATAIGFGIAAIAASTLLKNFGGARAEGGPVGSNKTYLVGERGPELFVPNVAGNIVPNDEIQSFGGGLASVLGGKMASSGSLLRGNDILLAYARTQRSQLRVNG